MTGNDSTADRGRFDVEGTDWWRLAGVLGLVVLVALVLPFVVFGVPQIVGAEHSYVVLSGSMEPTISPGDAVIVEDVQPAAIERGDVITFAESGDVRTTTHRVVAVVARDGAPAFRTKGDNNEDPDQELIAADRVEGRVVNVGSHLLVFPLIGHVIRFASTSLGYALLVAIPITALVLSEMWLFLASAREQPGDDEATAATSLFSDALSDGDGTGSTDGVFAGGTPDEDSDPSAERTTGSAADAPAADEARLGDAGPSASGLPESDDGVTIRAGELRLGLLVLAGFCAYSVGVAVVETAVWSIAVAASVLVGFVLLGGLYLLGGAEPAEDGENRVGGATDD